MVGRSGCDMPLTWRAASKSGGLGVPRPGLRGVARGLSWRTDAPCGLSGVSTRECDPTHLSRPPGARTSNGECGERGIGDELPGVYAVGDACRFRRCHGLPVLL